MESSFLTRDQTLILWSGSSDSKTLDYQRTNPREYQIMRTQRKPLEYKTRHHPTTSSTLCRTPHLSNKRKIQTQSSVDRITISLSLAYNKKPNKNSAQISPYTKLTQTTGPTLGGKKPKGRKTSALRPRKGRPQTQ